MDRTKAENFTRVALIIVPIAIVYTAPWLVDADTWGGGAFGLALVFGQIFLLVWLPDKVGEILSQEGRERPPLSLKVGPTKDTGDKNNHEN